MVQPDLLRQLRRIVGDRYVSVGQTNAEVYSYDASLAVGAPDAVVLPADTQETAAVVRSATAAGVPYVPRGFGTNLSGGSIARRGGLVIEMSRLNRILALRPQGRYAVVQPGATSLELRDALAPLGFFYAPDPASQKVATFGGNAGENSGGPHCLKYGVTTNHVLGMTVVLPGGEVVRVGGPALDPPGYDLRGVLVGSEGTLGIATELVVRILPQPESVITLLAIYDVIADAARSVSEIIASGIVPATLEMMDATVMRAVEESLPCGYPLDAAAVLIAEVDGPVAGLERQAERTQEICRKNGCREVRRAKDAAERDLLWAGRRGAFGAIARLAPNYYVADCTVPRSRLPEALDRVAAIAEKHRLPHGNVFHAGDGNLHPLLFFDSRDADQVHRIHEAGEEILASCAALGGTITGEHGVGTEKLEAMRLVFSEDDLDLQRELRKAFDANDLMNPGKVVPSSVRVEGPAEPTPPKTADKRGLAPADAAEARDMVRRAFTDRIALLPLGNATRPDFGNSSGAVPVPLRSARLSGVIDYDPANQVITVGAGISLGVLQGILAEHHQWLPIRPPLGDRTTVGGIAALGACGPERLRYGAPRDLLLGLRFVSGTGRLISAGGRVVKNVAGYDLTRLLAGAGGTLGFITEATFRVSSIPEQCTALVASGPLERCGAAAADLLGSRLEATAVVAVPTGPGLTTDDNEWQLMAAFEGFGETVRFQKGGGGALLDRAGMRAREALEHPARRGMCAEFFEVLESFPFLLRVDLPPDQVVPFLSAAGEMLRGTALLVDLGCGRVAAAMSELADDAWTRLCEIAQEMKGHAILEKAPSQFKARHDVFGPPREDWAVMHAIKTALDPHNIFSPGRLPGRK